MFPFTNSTISNSTTGRKLVLNYQISTNTNSTDSNCTTVNKLIVNDQISINVNSTKSNSTHIDIRKPSRGNHIPARPYIYKKNKIYIHIYTHIYGSI